MIETTLPPAPDLWVTVPAPDSAPLLEQVATLRLENAALCVENTALRGENACGVHLLRRLGVTRSTSVEITVGIDKRREDRTAWTLLRPHPGARSSCSVY